MLSKPNIFPFKFISLILFFLLMFFSLSATVFAQSGSLEDIIDYTNNYAVGETAEHTVSFTLPIEAAPVRTTDYIHVYLEAFPDVTAPTAITGSYSVGPPVFSVSGRYARVTNIVMIPGNSLVIHGITATNPYFESMYRIAVIISEDAAGTIIKNIGYAYSQVFHPFLGGVSVTASIDTPQSRLIIEGYTAPTSYMTFTEAGSVIGTGLSGYNGFFRKIFSGLQPGNHQVVFYGVDPNRLTTTPVIINIYLPSFQETTVTNQLLSPTLRLNKSGFYQGESIVATGSASPNGNITLFTEAPLRSYSTTANENGDWSYTITNTNEYVLGDYQVRVLVQDGIGTTSLNSPSVGFSMLSTSSDIGEPCGDIEEGDLNCDALIDLTDFSILMYYWGTNNAIADINQDDYVNLTDFSIMMYFWGT